MPRLATWKCPYCGEKIRAEEGEDLRWRINFHRAIHKTEKPKTTTKTKLIKTESGQWKLVREEVLARDTGSDRNFPID